MSDERFDLAAARADEGFTVAALADELGVHRETLRRLERGQHVRPDKAKIVADHFGVRVRDLMPPAEEPVR